MATISVTDARATLPQLLDRVLEGEEVTIVRHGQPVAVLVRPDTLRARRADRALAGAEHVQHALKVGGQKALSTSPGITLEWAEELRAEIETGRNGR